MKKEDVEIIILEYIKKNEYKEDFVFSTSNIEDSPRTLVTLVMS